MGKLTRVEVTLGLSWLLVAACGGATMAPSDDSVQEFDPLKSTPNNTAANTPAAGTMAPAMSGIARAFAKIEPLAVAPTMPSTDPMTSAGAAGMPAEAAGTGAEAAAGVGGEAGTSAEAAGSGGAAGTGMGAGLAAGSGGEAGATGAEAGSGAAGMGMDAAATGAAGMAAPASDAAAGTAAPGPGPQQSGAGGAEAPASIIGTASFASNPNGVNLTVMVSGCQSGKEYPIHLHEGGSCESAMTQGGHWDMTRGEGIPNIRCGGRAGATTLMRPKSDPSTAWSVGDGSPTDVVGRTVVIHDADDPMVRIACGVIAKN